MTARVYGLALAWCLLGPIGPAAAQPQSGLPQELLDTTRKLQGDSVVFCIDPNSVAANFDRKVSEAIAAALLLTPVFMDAPTGFALDGAGYLDELQLAMNNTCDVVPGFSLQPDSAFPEWAAPTRAYAEIPFVLAVTDPDYQRLGDIPRSVTIGTAIGSLGENRLITYNRQQPEAQRWRRLPYADPALMLKRLQDGTLGAILLWGPSLSRVTDGNPEAAGLRLIPTDPVPAASALVGALVSSRDSFLRSEIDAAIGALIADGTLAELLAAEGIDGRPGPQ